MSGDQRDPQVAVPEPHVDVPPQLMASWPVPAWATRSDSDGGLVSHTRPIAEVRTLDQQPGGEHVVEAVEVGQADYVVTTDLGEVRVEREAPEILVGNLRLDSATTRRLAAALVFAADIVDAGLVEQLPAAERGTPS